MSTQLKLRRGTTAQHSTFTGASGEVTVDTDKKTLVVHDGSTAGGSPLAVDSGVVHTSGNETIAGAKTFSGGLYASGSFSGSYSDGLVSDYSTGWGRLTVGAADGFYFRNNGTSSPTTLATLDASGNLGLGVTPSSSTAKTFEIGGLGNTLVGFGTSIYFSENAYYNSGFKYAQTGNLAAQYAMDTGQHRWFIAPSGTAGNPITFTQAMTLDASGNLGVGTTSPASRVDVTGTDNAATSLYAKIYSANRTVNLGFGYQRIETNGDLAVVAGGYTAFTNNGSERARIDSSGNLLVGKTAGTFSAAGTIVYANGEIDITNSGNISLALNRLSSDGQTAQFFRQTVQVGNISVTSTATAYNTSSDYRLKDITGPVTGAKDFVMALQPKQGTWKADGSKFVGFVAHEFQEVSPSSVTGEKDAVDENGNPLMQSMQASSPEVMANLVALLQEQQAIIQQLQADVAALKALKQGGV